MNYLGKPTQGKGFAVVTLTKPLSGPDLARTDRCISLRDRTKKAEPLTRAARRAQRVQDRPRRRRRSGRSCATERSEGAPVLAQRPAALPRSLASSARRSAPSTGCGWKHLPPPPSARARACAAGFSRSAVAPSRFAIRRVVTAQNSNHHTLSQSIRLHAGWPCPVASERREPREPDLDAATGLLPSRSRSRFAPQASVGPPLLVRECDDLHLNSEPSGFPLRADPLEARITPIRTATERQRRSTVSGSQSPEPRRSGSDGAPFLDVLYEPIRSRLDRSNHTSIRTATERQRRSTVSGRPLRAPIRPPSPARRPEKNLGPAYKWVGHARPTPSTNFLTYHLINT